jgi:hypothetical protein
VLFNFKKFDTAEDESPHVDYTLNTCADKARANGSKVFTLRNDFHESATHKNTCAGFGPGYDAPAVLSSLQDTVTHNTGCADQTTTWPDCGGGAAPPAPTTAPPEGAPPPPPTTPPGVPAPLPPATVGGWSSELSSKFKKFDTMEESPHVDYTVKTCADKALASGAKVFTFRNARHEMPSARNTCMAFNSGYNAAAVVGSLSSLSAPDYVHSTGCSDVTATWPDCGGAAASVGTVPNPIPPATAIDGWSSSVLSGQPGFVLFDSLSDQPYENDNLQSCARKAYDRGAVAFTFRKPTHNQPAYQSTCIGYKGGYDGAAVQSDIDGNPNNKRFDQYATGCANPTATWPDCTDGVVFSYPPLPPKPVPPPAPTRAPVAPPTTLSAVDQAKLDAAVIKYKASPPPKCTIQ